MLHRLQRTAGNHAAAQLLRHSPTNATAAPASPSPALQRDAVAQRDDPPKSTSVPEVEIPLIPPSWLHEPGRADMLVAVAGDKMVALPAAGVFRLVRPQTPEIPQADPTAVLTLPTIAKESAKAVRTGPTTSFLIDAGGRPDVMVPTDPIVVTPGALAVMNAALGVQGPTGMVITHLHDDHVQSFVELVVASRIRPENIHFPEGFASNPAAPSSTFARLLRALQADTRAQGFGHTPTAQYGTIRTPAQGNWWKIELRQGEVTFELYGLTGAFRALEARRAAGQQQKSARLPSGEQVESLADTASLITRVTHVPSGMRMLFPSDARFNDLGLLKRAMGAEDYREMLSGVKVVEGLGHHIGALESSADQTAFAEFLKDAQLTNGRLIVMAQSQETRSGRQFLNRSMIAALNEAGIDVHVALEPTAGVGTFTVDSAGRVTYAGPGRAESFLSSAPVRAEIDRLNQLRAVERTLTRFERFAEPQYRRSQEVKAAREQLENVLDSFMDTTAGNTRPGAGRAQQSVRDPVAQAAALSRAQQTRAPVESILSTGFMDGLEELGRLGPHYEVFEREVEAARKTGRMSDEGIDALWELHPETARRLLGSSGLSRQQQRSVARQLPGQPASVQVRSVAAVLLLVEAANLAAPIVQEIRASRYGSHVKPALDAIMWWQAKGVFPTMEAVDDNLWPWDNEWTTDAKRIQTLLEDDEVSYLTLTGIPDDNWDRFTVWASGKLRNVRDWQTHIVDSPAIRSKSGQFMGDETFEYLTSEVKGETVGFDLTTTWRSSPRLDLILKAAAKEVVKNSDTEIANIEKQQGDSYGPAVVSDRGFTAPLYGSMAKATGKVRFRSGVDPVLYTVYLHSARTGYSTDSLFYTFPNTVTGHEVPEGYTVVGGADYNTYSRVLATRNDFVIKNADGYGGHRAGVLRPNTLEVLLAKTADLEAPK
ncbi:hypothetical protein [Rathayibacter sp. YIM 133350]|uniref:hypothetical protein n=1 Tax=Rathayibacter sp. YIM 133350 TaxID=3131992 RepID=UPI00307EA44E